MIHNFNIGILGHVDSGKTSLARALSSISSTAAFDKNPQSQERGITLDLGFSGLLIEAPKNFWNVKTDVEKLQFTFVDCPGHASLIRTIIGGAQIIDLMLLVIDAQKGIQTQTAECIVIGELLKKRLIVVVNKIDLLEEHSKVKHLNKLITKIRKSLERTYFGGDVPIYSVSALKGNNINQLLDGISSAYYVPTRLSKAPLLMYIDHCFSIKGQGTICTGTIVQGSVAVHDSIELPSLNEQRKVKSIQMFRRPVNCASTGDRVGLCVAQLNSKHLERGIVAQPGYLKPIYAVCVRFVHIPYYKNAIKSKSKFHISLGHETLMASVTLFREANINAGDYFDSGNEFEYIEEITADLEFDQERIYTLIELEKPVLTTLNSTLIASKLDMDAHSSGCRLAFWGKIEWLTENPNYGRELLPQWRIFKRKEKQGTVQRIVNEREVIVQNLFKNVTNRAIYVGKTVKLSTGENGYIDSTFGQTSKVRICFPETLAENTLKLLKNGPVNDVRVLLCYKKYIFNKNLGLFQ